jgi:hypothetical protein
MAKKGRILEQTRTNFKKKMYDEAQILWLSLHIYRQNILLSDKLKQFNGQETHILMVNS